MDWGHSLAYSVENFINPQHIHFKYLDFYGGYHNKPGANMRWYLPYLREYYTSTKLPLNALHNQPLTVYDVTMWLWVYYPHYSYADAPWFEFANGFPDFNCGSYSHTYFFP